MYSKNYVSRKTKTANNLEQRVHHKKSMNYHQVVYLYTCIMSFPKRLRKHGTVPNASVVRHCRGRFRGCFASSSQPALIPIALLSFPWRAEGGLNFLQPGRCPPETTACARSPVAGLRQGKPSTNGATGARVATTSPVDRPAASRGLQDGIAIYQLSLCLTDFAR